MSHIDKATDASSSLISLRLCVVGARLAVRFVLSTYDGGPDEAEDGERVVDFRWGIVAGITLLV